MDAYALGALEAGERAEVEAHAAACPACRETLAELDRIKDALRAGAVARAVGASDRLMEAVRRDRRSARISPFGSHWFWNRALLPLAASLLIALTGIGLWRRRASAPTAAARIEWARDGIYWTSAHAFRYPLVAGPRLFALRQDGTATRLAAFDKATGRALWETEAAISGPLVADEQRVYGWQRNPESVGVRALVALDAAAGAELWRRERPLPARARDDRLSVLLSGSDLFLADGFDLMRLDSATGEPAWSLPAGDRPALALAGADSHGQLIAVLTDALRSLDPRDGTILWTTPLRRALPSYTAPLVAMGDGAVVLAHRDFPALGRLAGYDAQTGAELWEQAIGAPSALQAYREQVFVNAGDTRVFVARTGARLWATDLDGCGPVAAEGNTVYLVGGIRRQTVMALDRRDGSPVWTLDLTGSCSGLVVDRGHAFLSGHNGALYALALGEEG